MFILSLYVHFGAHVMVVVSTCSMYLHFAGVPLFWDPGEPTVQNQLEDMFGSFSAYLCVCRFSFILAVNM